MFNILHIVLLASLYSCIEDPDVEPGVKGADKPKFEGPAVPGERTATTISVSANIITANGAKITERGFYYGTTSSPKPENGGTKLPDLTAPAEIGTGSYTMTIEGLINDTTYYIVPYAINSEGEGFAGEINVRTNSGWAGVKTLMSEGEERASSIKAGGEITFAGEGDVTKLGVYVFEKENPSMIDTIYFDDVVYPTTISAGETFLCKVTGLTPSTWYDVQAFVTNTYATTVGEKMSACTRNGLPVIDTIIVVEKGYTEVTLTSSVNNGGDETVIIEERGFCWAEELETSEPTILNNTIRFGGGEGDFGGTIPDLVSQGRYYARAYAKSDLGVVGYGKVIFVQTKTDVPSVTTVEATNVLNGNANVKGIIDDEGISEVTASGICWSITNPAPTVSDNIFPLSAGSGREFSGQLTGLRGGVTYYVCAYAVNEKGTGYGNVVKIPTPPIFTDGLKQFSGNMRLPNSMAYFAVNDYLYIVGGDIGASYTDELWRYSVAEDTWEPRLPFDGGPMKWQSGVSYGVGALVYGGDNGNHNERPGIYYYDATDVNKWFYYEGPDMTTICRTIGYSSNNSVFYIGGKSVEADTVREDVWSFDFPSKIWQKKTDFPVKQYGGVAVVIDNIAYVGMGKDTTDVCNGNLWMTADRASTWTLKTSYAVTGSVLAGVACNKRLYIVDESYYILEYNPETDEWTEKSQLPAGHRGVHCMYAISNKIYIGLGSSASSKSFVVYNPLWDNEGP